MATNSSFYVDGSNTTTGVVTSNDNPNPSSGNTTAPSSFYQNGDTYLTAANQGDTLPLMDGVAAIGTSTKWAHQDHVHPTDTSRAPLASPAFTGTPTAPTASIGTNTTQLATTAFVLANGGGGGMAIGSTVTSGTSGSVLFVDASGHLAQNNANFNWNDTNTQLSLGGTQTASHSLLSINGTQYRGGTATATMPFVLFKVNGGFGSPISWNTGGTIWGADVDGSFSGNLMDFRFAGNQLAFVDYQGSATFNLITSYHDVNVSRDLYISGDGANGLTIPNHGYAYFGSGSSSYAGLRADDGPTQGALALFDGATGTGKASLRVYNAWSSSGANYERAVFDWLTTSNVLTIGTQMSGTGVARPLQFVYGGTGVLDYGITNASSWTFVGNIVSPALTGTPTAPTATVGTNTTQIATTAFVLANSVSAAAVRSYLSGLTLSTAGSSTTFTVAAGVGVDSTNAIAMTLASSINKTTGAWTVGTGNGALDTGSIAASTWYHVYLIERTDLTVTDVLISLSASAPTMPANYTFKRRIGAMKTNGSSQWTLFHQLGDEFLWDTPVVDVNVSTLSTTATLFTLSVPAGVQINSLFRGNMNNATLGTLLLINSPDESAVASSALLGNQTADNAVSGSAAGNIFTLNVRTNTSAQIRAVSSVASTGLAIATYGWIDTRGKLS
jgi:hypothetical protein